MSIIENYKNNCIICNSPCKNKTCSKTCLIKHRNNRRIKTDINKSITRLCKFCNNPYTRKRERNGFCTKSCASKYYYQNGTYTKWQKGGMQLNLVNKQDLVERTCCICNKTYYIKDDSNKSNPKRKNRSKTCSVDCRKEYAKQKNTGSNSYYYGKKLSEQHKQNTRNGMLKKYGVPVGYLVDNNNRKTTSKGQLELYELLKNYYKDFNVLKEQRIISTNPKHYIVDILFEDLNIIVEYNGDFWHCNPKIYDENYYNPKKQLTAKEIWNLDKERLEILQKCKYSVYTVWESDFINKKEETIKILLEEIDNEFRRKSINPRSSTT